MIENEALWGLGGAVIGALICAFLRDAWQETRIKRLKTTITELEEALYSAQQKQRGELGNQKKQEKAERQQSMMMEFATAMKGGSKIEDVIKEMAVKYPDIVFELAKKGLKI